MLKCNIAYFTCTCAAWACPGQDSHVRLNIFTPTIATDTLRAIFSLFLFLTGIGTRHWLSECRPLVAAK